MTVFESITQNPETFIAWLLSDKEAVCIDQEAHLFAGIETSTVLFMCDNDGYPIVDMDDEGNEQVHALDGATASQDIQDELRQVLGIIMNMEVDADGSPVDV